MSAPIPPVTVGRAVVKRHRGIAEPIKHLPTRARVGHSAWTSVCGCHSVVTRTWSAFAEFLTTAPGADEIVPKFSPRLLDESFPQNGR